VACLCDCALAGPGRADTLVYSTFGSGDSFSQLLSFTVAGSGPPSSAYEAEAMAFTPSATVTLDSISFAGVSIIGTLVVDAVVAQDASGAPGTALETFSSISLPTTAGILTECLSDKWSQAALRY
jgi:hypothetical protein